ncbi:xaa-Pro dipeptidase [Hyaloraphidium curvatum]|nr:xaa-Pro dipeptidase [Hyaloraphidium curvatum]
MSSKPAQVLMFSSDWQIGVWGAKVAQDMLMRGYTTVRDAAGSDGSIAQLVAEGSIIGPRVFPSGAMISQTSGHADFLPPFPLTYGDTSMKDRAQQKGLGTIADGAASVLWAARENLKRGATQIKLAAGGGVSSNFDSLFTTQGTLEEMKAAVAAAKNWGTYVMVHAYTENSMRQAIEAGVKQILHGNLATDEIMALIKQNNVSLETEIVNFWADYGTDPTATGKGKEIYDNIPKFMELVKKYDIPLGFGTDLILQNDANKWQSKEFTLRAQHFPSVEVLRQATSITAAQIMACGPLNPYGRFGEIREGYLADLLVVNGDPTKDVSLLENARDNIAMIVKDGKVYKNIM